MFNFIVAATLALGQCSNPDCNCNPCQCAPICRCASRVVYTPPCPPVYVMPPYYDGYYYRPYYMRPSYGFSIVIPRHSGHRGHRR